MCVITYDIRASHYFNKSPSEMEVVNCDIQFK